MESIIRAGDRVAGGVIVRAERVEHACTKPTVIEGVIRVGTIWQCVSCGAQYVLKFNPIRRHWWSRLADTPVGDVHKAA